MQRFSGLAVAWRRGEWGPQWRAPEPQAAYDAVIVVVAGRGWRPRFIWRAIMG